MESNYLFFILFILILCGLMFLIALFIMREKNKPVNTFKNDPFYFNR